MIAVQPTITPFSLATRLLTRPSGMAAIHASITLGWVMSRLRNKRSCSGGDAMKVFRSAASSADIRRNSVSAPLQETVRGYSRETSFMLIAFPTIDPASATSA
jgi:hypothetical protein